MTADETETTKAWYATGWGRRAILAVIVIALAGLRLLYPEIAGKAVDCTIWSFGAVTLVDQAYVTFLAKSSAAPAAKAKE